MRQTLLQKVWDTHAVRILPTGQTQLFIGLHLIHEVTSPQAFDMLRMRGSKVAFPNRTFATVDHIVPTLDQSRPFLDVLAEEMLSALADVASLDALAEAAEHPDPAEPTDEASASMTIAELSIFQPSRIVRFWSWLRYGAWRWRTGH